MEPSINILTSVIESNIGLACRHEKSKVLEKREEIHEIIQS